MAKETAQSATNRAAAEVLSLLQIIAEQVNLDLGEIAQRKAETGRGADWGDAGSMNHIREKLLEVAVGQQLTPGASEAEVGRWVQSAMSTMSVGKLEEIA